MNYFNHTFLLRLALAIILVVHGVGGMFNNGITDFGNFYLNKIGFSPIGVPLAWAIKLSHVAAAICLLFDRYLKVAGGITIVILIAGIALVHFPSGWFVVGGGRNGVEFNFLLIFALLTVMFPKGFVKIVKIKSVGFTLMLISTSAFSIAATNIFLNSTTKQPVILEPVIKYTSNKEVLRGAKNVLNTQKSIASFGTQKNIFTATRKKL